MSDKELASVMRAILSRPERWTIEEVELRGAQRPVRGYRLTVTGSVVLDRQHADAVRGVA